MARNPSRKKEALNTLSVQELEARLKDSQETRFRLQFRHTTTPLKNPMEIRHTRREIARLKTLLREKAGTPS